MALRADDLIDRRRLRRKLTFWRVAAILLAAAAAVAATVLLLGQDRFGVATDHIAKVRIEGTITEDEDLLETLEEVGEIHLAGHAVDRDDEGAPLLIDNHDRAVDDAVWALFSRVIARGGPLPTLIEWDKQVPDWPMLLAEALTAERILADHKMGNAHAAAG